MNFYKFHIGDYASATRHLTWDEDMAYRRLLDSYYTNESPLPAERRLIYRLTCASSNDQRAAVDAVLEEFFTLTDDGWRHFRCDAEIAEATKKGEKASYAARKMWEERRAKAGDSCVGNANASKIDANASKIDAAISQKHKKQAHQDAPDADASKNNANASKTKADASIFDATHYPLPTTQTQGKPSGSPRFDCREFLIDKGVTEPVCRDWLALRKQKRAPVTETAINGIVREAQAAGMSLDAVLALCCQRGWQGFKAEWVQDKHGGGAYKTVGQERAEVAAVLTGSQQQPAGQQGQGTLIEGEARRVA